MRRALVFLLGALPLPAGAEGARLELSCAVANTCNAEGQCNPGGGQRLEITLAPQDTDAAGAGRYSVTVSDTETVAEALSGTGPFVWTELNGDRLTLVIGTERTALIQRQPAGDIGATRIDFLNCEITA